MAKRLLREYWGILVLLITLLIYAKTIHFEFLSFDDGLYITNNFWVINFTWDSVWYFFTNNVFGHYFPITMLTYGIQSKVFGLNPMPFHAFNLIIHILNILLVGQLSKKLGLSYWVYVFVVSLFALHPIQVESIAWVGTRAGILSSFFSLISLNYYLKYLKTNNSNKMVFTSVFFVFAVLSKSQAILLTPLYFVFDYYFKRKFSISLILEKAHLFIISFVFGVISIIAARELGTVSSKGLATGETLPGYFRLLEVLYSASYYFNAIIIPVDYTAMHYNPNPETDFFPPRFFWGFVIPIGFFALSLVMKIKTRLIFFSIGFYFITLLSVINIIPLGGTIVSERYGYFASIPTLIILGSFFERIFEYYLKNKVGHWLLLIGFCFVLSVFSFNRLEVWRNTYNLFEDIYIKAPNIAHAQNGFANELARKKDFERSIDLQTLAVESTPNAKHYGDRGGVYYMMDSLDLALEDYCLAINLNATSSEYYRKRAFVKQKLGDFKGTLKDVNIAIEIDPNDYVARELRAETHFYLGDIGGACKDWRYLESKGDKKYSSKISKYCIKNVGELETGKTIYHSNGKKKFEVIIDSTENEKVQWLLSNDSLGNIIEKGEIKNGKYNGKVYWYYPSGELLREGFFIDVLPYGEWKEYYKDGTVKSKFSHKNGVKDGAYFYYYKNGQLWTEKEYKNGMLFMAKKLFDKSGFPLEKGNFNEGNGTLFVYDSTSTLIQKVNYKNGKIISYQNI